jgi:hypothetical protein
VAAAVPVIDSGAEATLVAPEPAIGQVPQSHDHPGDYLLNGVLLPNQGQI